MSHILSFAHRRPHLFLVATIVAVATSAVAFFTVAPARSTVQANHHRYQVFSQSPTPGDLEPNNWRVSPNKLASDRPELGLQSSGTRVLRRDRTMTLAAIPGKVGGCLLESFADGSEGLECTSATDPTTAFITAGKAVGLVPDGVDSVTFHMTDGTDVTGPVTDNTYSAPAEAATVTIDVDGQAKLIDLIPTSTLPPGTTVESDGLVTTGN